MTENLNLSQDEPAPASQEYVGDDEADEEEKKRRMAEAILKKQMGQYPEPIITFSGTVKEYLASHPLGKHFRRKKR